VSGRNCRPARRLNVGTITTSEQSALGTRALPGRKVNRIGRIRTERRARTTPSEASLTGIAVRERIVRPALVKV
jgi:hypothetical protein